MLNILTKIISPFLIGWGRTPVLWIWKKPKNDVDALLLFSSKHFNPRWNSKRYQLISRFIYLFMLLIWPVRALLIISIGMWHYAKATKIYSGKSYLKQFIDQLEISFRYWVNPEVYYLYRLFERKQLNQARNFFLGSTISALRGYVDDNKTEVDVQNKYVFNRTMEKKGFPVIKDIALIDEGKIYSDGKILKNLILPEGDVFIKPNLGNEGRGIRRIEWLGQDQYLCSDGHSFSKKSLTHHLLELSNKESLLVQPRLINHEDISDLSNNSFNTCRIVTGILPTGEVELILGVFKMPVGDGVADNFSTGGIACSINITTGLLDSAISKNMLSPSYDRHPDTQALILGRQLPFWEETISLIKSAHKNMDTQFVTLGWDVGFTKEGPIIIEVGVKWGSRLSQRPGMISLGSTNFPNIIRQWIDHKRNIL